MASPARADAGKLRLLILGGTGFIGPHYVRAAVARGHEVAVFNRGRSDAVLPAGVERLVGDRDGDLAPVRGRDWDAVIDLGTLTPRWVRSLGEALAGRVGHFTFISTVAVYDPLACGGEITQDSPTLAYHGSGDPYAITEPQSVADYGALKVLCEQEAERWFPGRALVLRPGYIVGPGDPQDFLVYWPARMEAGGEVLVTGDPKTKVQWIDVRDLADWSLDLVEAGATGVFNVAGPAAPTTLAQLVSAAREAVSTAPDLTWVEAEWLAGREDRDAWARPLFWTSAPAAWAWSMRMRVEPALAAGLTTRPLQASLADTRDWFESQSPARKAELLPGAGGADAASWKGYLAREAEVLAAWRSERG